MSSSQELNCKTFYDELIGCPTSRFSGRGQGCLANALGFFPPLILGVRRIGGKGEGIGVNSRSMAISVR
jgi:hypothetical protein